LQVFTAEYQAQADRLDALKSTAASPQYFWQYFCESAFAIENMMAAGK